MTGPSQVVFLSYASQDAQAAEKICAALSAAGIEVFLDQSELRGGDAWDQKIRHEIHDCALFIPIVSQHTQQRLEGYFRHEWNLAIERTHHMAQQKPFLVPVAVDGTGDTEAFVPDAFRAVQWTRLPGGDTPAAFVERIKRLLSPELSPLSAVSAAAPGISEQAPASRRSMGVLLAIVAVVVFAALAYLFADRFWISKQLTPSAAAFAPPAHSVAVLPFVNMSGDKEQEYFSDGLTDELLNSLAQVSELQVAARTSAFSFKGKDTDIGTIARKLNVGAVLEGSVRRSGNTVRVTTQLINAITGFHLWSHTYDRDLGDVLKLESEIAAAVASALKVSLLGDVATKIELGGTRNPAAFDACLRGRRAALAAHGNKDLQTAIAAFTEAIGLDPNYALAFANRSTALAAYAGNASEPLVRESFDKALADARQAIALAPDLAEGHLALAYYFEAGSLDFIRANEEYERALALAPGNARMLRVYGLFAVRMGRTEAGIAAAQHAVVLDPLNRSSRSSLGAALYFARQNSEALAAVEDTLALDPEYPPAYAFRGLTYYRLGDFERARASCERKPDYWVSQQCLAVTYDKLGRHADALGVLAKMKASAGEAAAYQYATIYAQWGIIPQALEWLDTAMRLRDPGLESLKADPLLEPLRKEPRFQGVMRELKFPE
ncbi:MAG: TIR domain-containing protein [Steroidobacteraceae bacterium]